MTSRRPIAVTLATLLAGCGAPQGSNTVAASGVDATPASVATPSLAASPSADTARPVIAIDGEGLRLVDPESGSTRPIPFGTPREATLAAVASLGTPDLGTDTQCSYPYATYRAGLTLNFEDGKFAGWFLDGSRKPEIGTMAGIGIGSTRAEIDDVYAGMTVAESTLGQEFLIGDMAGLIDGTGPTARVTHLWAGVVCLAR